MKKASGPIAWMARNPVAANIAMLFLLVGGLFWSTRIQQEVFPEFEVEMVAISVAYPGASPEDVEQGIILPIEEAISELDGIGDVESTALDNLATVRVEALHGTNLQQLATDIRSEVDRISSFPVEAEEPVITVPLRRRSVVTLLLYGDVDPAALRETAEQVRDQLLQDPGITQVTLDGERELEIAIDVRQDMLRKYRLSLEDITRRIQGVSIDLPGGTIKDQSGHIALRVDERRDLGREFASVPIITTPDGGQVLLGDIARISDGFAESDTFYTYNGQPAIGLEVYRVGDQTPVSVSNTVRAHMERLRETLPPGISAETVNDQSDIYKQRLDLLLKNGYFGLILVFFLLALFLEPRLAFWVTLGIPISFLGSLLFLPMANVSINMISLFAFIVTLGIVVDDAIIVGENVYTMRQRGLPYLEAAVAGAREMAVPISFAVLTNIVTFMPLYFIPGEMGNVFRHIPLVVALVFLISLVESLFVLPAHLGYQKEVRNTLYLRLVRMQEALGGGITRFLIGLLVPSLTLALRFRYVWVTISIAVLLLTGAYVKSGRMGMTMFPQVESDRAQVSFALPVGTDVARTREVETRLLRAARQVSEANGGSQLVQGIHSTVNGESGRINVYLTAPEVRPLSTTDFVTRWREAAGPLPGLDTLRFQANSGGPGSGAGLTVELRHRDSGMLEEASAALAAELAHFAVVSDINNGFSQGKAEFSFEPLPAAYRLGLTPAEVASQIRSAYHGKEVNRQLRGRNELKIMVRLEEGERHSLASLHEMVLRTPSGGEADLDSLIRITPDQSLTKINRRNFQRVNTVSADINPPKAGLQVEEQLKEMILPGLALQFPGLDASLEGRQADRRESMASLGQGMMIAMLLVYTLLAVVFRSYWQPGIIMTAIPFGLVGAVAGHLIMGYSLSLVSFFGMVALSGVVVNDSLVLIDQVNRLRRQGQTAYAAVINSAALRLRPILLTTFTTFFGLMPMIFETSRQARFLIPMAISLGFGILFATTVTLLLIPALYLILEDVQHLRGALTGKG